MEHRRQAAAKEIEWLEPGTRGDVCRVGTAPPWSERPSPDERSWSCLLVSGLASRTVTAHPHLSLDATQEM
jgi:hypothetical protein